MHGDDFDLHDQEDLSIFGWTGYPDPTVGLGRAEQPRRIVDQEELSVFGDTYPGVPNPLVGHVHPYPTRFHGPIWNQPMFTQPWVERPYAQVPFTGLGAAPLDPRFPLPGGATPDQVTQTKSAIQMAMDADVKAGASAYNPDALDDLTGGFLRGVPDQLQAYIAMLQAEHYVFTAQAFQSRLAQVSGQSGPQPRTATMATSLSSQLLQESPFWKVMRVVSTGIGAYHGYKRNQSIGWALWWGLMGGIFPIVTPAIAFAQGIDKPKPRTA